MNQLRRRPFSTFAVLALMVGCGMSTPDPYRIDVSCDGDTELETRVVSWDLDEAGLESEFEDFVEGWDGEVYATRTDWEGLLDGAVDPIPSVDFEGWDAVLWYHIHGGCEDEIFFPLACDDGKSRRVLADNAELSVSCDATFQVAYVIAIPKTGTEDLIVVGPTD